MKLLVIDPNVSSKSPSMRAWLEAYPTWEHLFDEIEIWASNCDLPETGKLTWRKIPQRVPTWKLHSIDFQLRVDAMMKMRGADPGTIVQATGCTSIEADINYIHYWHTAFLEECKKRPASLKLGPIGKCASILAKRRESRTVALNDPHRSWWVVSRSLAAFIQDQGVEGRFDVLPNQYDPSRFNSSVRDEWRDKMRSHYGIGAHETVFVFSGFGHFIRKGLLQGIEAVAELRRRGHAVRYLVLGGSKGNLSRIRKDLSPEQDQACVFAGIVDNIERHLVAADALLFPSHFEAFSLAEIEAAALGLRLYLTPHYGSEMIVREPVNGRILSWNPVEMADTLESDIRNELLDKPHSELGEAITPAEYADRLLKLYKAVIRRKEGNI